MLQLFADKNEPLAVGRFAGQPMRLLVEHLGGAVAGDAAESFVDLNYIAGRVGDQDRGGGVFKHRGRHAQFFGRLTLFADVATDPEQSFEMTVFIPHQRQVQLHRDLAPVGAQGVEQEALRR